MQKKADFQQFMAVFFAVRVVYLPWLNLQLFQDFGYPVRIAYPLSLSLISLLASSTHFADHFQACFQHYPWKQA